MEKLLIRYLKSLSEIDGLVNEEHLVPNLSVYDIETETNVNLLTDELKTTLIEIGLIEETTSNKLITLRNVLQFSEDNIDKKVLSCMSCYIKKHNYDSLFFMQNFIKSYNIYVHGLDFDDPRVCIMSDEMSVLYNNVKTPFDKYAFGNYALINNVIEKNIDSVEFFLDVLKINIDDTVDNVNAIQYSEIYNSKKVKKYLLKKKFNPFLKKKFNKINQKNKEEKCFMIKVDPIVKFPDEITKEIMTYL